VCVCVVVVVEDVIRLCLVRGVSAGRCPVVVVPSPIIPVTPSGLAPRPCKRPAAAQERVSSSPLAEITPIP
jgi:hypothetical protein